MIDYLGEIYVDNTNPIVTWLELTTPEALLEYLHVSADAWALSLNSTGGAINPEKSQSILMVHKWVNSLWSYCPQPQTGMTIPLPDRTRAPISHRGLSTVEKLLGVWSLLDRNGFKHIEENIVDKTNQWINKMRNAYLPACLGWVAYKFKLWAGIRYCIAILSFPLIVAQRLLCIEDFHCLSFLGINRNVKMEWRTHTELLEESDCSALPWNR
jgi:hypothetical protein